MSENRKDIDEAIETIASRMYFLFERIDPGSEDTTWDQLSPEIQRVYRSVVRDLSACANLWNKLDDYFSGEE